MNIREIPAEAVEAAADWLPHSGDCESRPERDCTCRLPRMNLMRAALEAATPYMLGRVQVGSFELIAPDVTRIGDTISYGGHLYVRDTP